jgi:4-diphosphocytidyl-2-C-methyl-D-erythritol kinase
LDPTRRLTPVVRLAPAKVNLTLAVIGRRPDGYHSLHSVVAPLGLSDRLSLAVAAGGTDTLAVSGLDPGPSADNLVLMALAATRRRVASTWPGAPGTPPALAARLDKRIPIAAGLGGGSSDAAAAIDGGIEAWSGELDDEARAEVAIEVGSDVPSFLPGGPVLMEGRGERVTPLHGLHCEPGGEPAVLLVTPDVRVHTREVFAAWGNGAMAEPGIARRSSEHFASEFGSGLSVQRLLERAAVLAAANDLLPASMAVLPGLRPLRRALARMLARPIGLSGSGPTLWALYPSLADAQRAATEIGGAIEDGRIVAPGDEPPSVIATIISARTPQSDPDTGERRSRA